MKILIVFLMVITASSFSLAGEALQVLSFNIWYGGKFGKSLNDTVSVIKKSGADLIGVQEQDGKGKDLADALHFHSHSVPGPAGGGVLLSRFPITKTFRHGIEVILPSGKKAYLFSVHLRPNPYQPYDLRDGKLKTEADAIAAARKTRGDEVTDTLKEMKPYLKSGAPVFLVGDFNEPSHLDWTERTAGVLHQMKVEWPATKAVAEAGLKDAYRAIYPDEVKKLGYTWSPHPYEGDIWDRIDFLFFAGSVDLKNVEIIGEKGGPDVDIIGFHPYPSDHRAVLGAFEMKEKYGGRRHRRSEENSRRGSHGHFEMKEK